jgi:AmmeMemoRadiSam system protein B
MKQSREPYVSGQFYPGTKMALEKTLAKLTEKVDRADAFGAVCPHAGYIYSGKVAGEVMSKIKPKELFVIIGPNHTGIGSPYSIFAEGSWQTPLGEVDIDAALAAKLTQRSKYLKADKTAHLYEHSIEVQLPFLQYLMNNFKILPIVIGDIKRENLREAALDIAAVLKESKKECTIIASSDMTHYEPHNIAQTKDKEALNAILDMDEDALLDIVEALNISMCGVAPVFMTLVASKELGAKETELVDYKTSGDMTGDYQSVVGYGGVIIK